MPKGQDVTDDHDDSDRDDEYIVVVVVVEAVIEIRMGTRRKL